MKVPRWSLTVECKGNSRHLYVIIFAMAIGDCGK